MSKVPRLIYYLPLKAYTKKEILKKLDSELCLIDWTSTSTIRKYTENTSVEEEATLSKLTNIIFYFAVFTKKCHLETWFTTQ